MNGKKLTAKNAKTIYNLTKHNSNTKQLNEHRKNMETF